MRLPVVLHVLSRWNDEADGRVVAGAGRTRSLVVSRNAAVAAPPFAGVVMGLRRPRALRAAAFPLAALTLQAGRPRLVQAHGAADLPLARRLARLLHVPVAVRLMGDAAPMAAMALRDVDLVIVESAGQEAAAIAAGLPTERILAMKPGDLDAATGPLEDRWLALAAGLPAPPLNPREAPRVTVLLATYQRRELLRRCLAALEAQSYPRTLLQVVVVDNGSTDGSEALLAERAASGSVTVERFPESVLVTEARNRGLTVATGEVVAFTDDDCRPGPEWVAELVRSWRVGYDIVQGRTRGDPKQERRPLSRSQDTPFGYGLFETCNILYTRSLLGADPFDSAVPMALAALSGGKGPRDPTGEDTDLGWRLIDRGVPWTFAPRALVHHEVFPPDLGYLMRRAELARVFPILAGRHPGLRELFLWHRWFLSRRSAALWLGLLGGAAAGARRRPGLLGLAAPYLISRLAPLRPGRGERLRALPQLALVDLRTARALLFASVRTRTAVL